MSRPHAPYEKMPESLAELELDEAGLRALRKTQWVVTEKIHGASFALVADFAPSTAGVIVRAAKRKAFLEAGEDFFGHRALLERIGARVEDTFARVRTSHPEATQATIYGELFGGTYPHPDVPPCPGVEPVQTGISYSPRIEFSAFDLTVTLPDRGRVYIDYDQALTLFSAARLFCAEPLFTGSYEDAMSWPLGADSTIPTRLGLPTLGRPNPAEGVVVKPVKSLVVPTRTGLARPVVKRKIPQFAEDRRFHEAAKWTPLPGDADPLTRLEWETLSRVTENRLHATISKVGRIPPGDSERAREVLTLFIDEVWSDLTTHHGPTLTSLSPEDRVLLRSVLTDEARRLLDASTEGTASAGADVPHRHRP